jgi:hypothetical protein
MTAESTTTAVAPARDDALDATRTFAIWLMVACHVARLAPKAARPEFFKGALLIEPLCQSLFMAMVGCSLVYSLRSSDTRGRKGWGMRQVRRAGELYAIGLVLYAAQWGWQWPWTLFSNGILLTIAEAMLLFVPVVLLRRGVPSTLLLTAALALLSWGLEAGGIFHLVLNSGNGSVLPYSALTGFGVVCALLLTDHGLKARLAFLGFLTVLAAAVLWQAPFSELLSAPMGRRYTPAVFHAAGSGPEQLWLLATGGELRVRKLWYYSYSSFLVPLMMAMCAWIYAISALAAPLFRRIRPLWLVGRHSLGVYILHLVLIAVLSIAGGGALDASWLPFCFVGVLGCCYGYAAAKGA